MVDAERSSPRNRALIESRSVALAYCPSHRGEGRQDEKQCGAALRNGYRLDGVIMARFGLEDDVPIRISPAHILWGLRNH